MKLLTHPPLQTAIDRAQALIQIAENSNRAKVVEPLCALLKAVGEEKFTIGVISQAKRGKSTLINGLLGRTDDKVAPVGRAPTTSIISVFAQAPTESAIVSFMNGEKPISIGYDDVQRYTTEDQNPDNQKGVESLFIQGPFPNLENGVRLVDTPGSDNALSEMHDTVLLDFLPRADVLIFLVSADSPLTQSEMDLLKKVRQSDASKILFVINKIDRVEPDELEEGLTHNKGILAAVGFGNARIFCISAKGYFLKKTDPGTEALLAEIHRMLAEERLDILAQRLADRTTAIATELQQDLANEISLADKSEAEVRVDQDQLSQFQKELTRERPKVEQALPDLQEMIRNRATPDQRANLIRSELVKAFADLEILFSQKKPGARIPWHPSTLARIQKNIPSELASSFASQ